MVNTFLKTYNFEQLKELILLHSLIKSNVLYKTTIEILMQFFLLDTLVLHDLEIKRWKNLFRACRVKSRLNKELEPIDNSFHFVFWNCFQNLYRIIFKVWKHAHQTIASKIPRKNAWIIRAIYVFFVPRLYKNGLDYFIICAN